MRSISIPQQISRTWKGGAGELVESFSYPPPAQMDLIKCDFCTHKFGSAQGHAVHRRMLHLQVHAHEGTRLLKSLRDGSKTAMWPWEGVGIGRCWVASLGKGLNGASVFQLQPKQIHCRDDFGCDDDQTDGAEGRCGAGVRRSYSLRERQQLSSACGDISDKRTLFRMGIG